MNGHAIAKVKIELEPGTTISQAFVVADHVAMRVGLPVSFDFAGREETMHPHEHAATCVERWFLESGSRRAAEEQQAEDAARRDRPRFEPIPHGAVQARTAT